MLNIEIIAVGRIKAGPWRALWDEYARRVSWKVSLLEIEGRSQEEENRKIAEKLDPRAYVFILDEKGKALASRAFAARLDGLASQGRSRVQFVIGGADGLLPEIKQKADFLLSFGSQTWPHKLVRVMLIEQVYRASLIFAGHPYHRD